MVRFYSFFVFYIAIFSISPKGIFAQSGAQKFKSLHPGSFALDLPEKFKLKPMYPEKRITYDFCDYLVNTGDKSIKFELHSILRGRSEDDIKKLYDGGNRDDLNVTYRFQKDNWFVISGKMKRNGNNIYVKTMVGPEFVSDLTIEYPDDSRSMIEPLITKIAHSFKSD